MALDSILGFHYYIDTLTPCPDTHLDHWREVINP